MGKDLSPFRYVLTPPPVEGHLGVGDLLHIHVVPFEGQNVSALAAVSVTAPSYYLLRPPATWG
jgi:hypothetical protein